MNRATGRRKNAIARVRLQPGEGRVTVNEKDPLAYLGRRVLEMAALAPLRVTGTQRKFDITVKVIGGGTSGQAGAIAHGIARALCRYDPDFRAALKKAGLLTRDARVKERKKYGLKRARKACWSATCSSSTRGRTRFATSSTRWLKRTAASCFTASRARTGPAWSRRWRLRLRGLRETASPPTTRKPTSSLRSNTRPGSAKRSRKSAMRFARSCAARPSASSACSTTWSADGAGWQAISRPRGCPRRTWSDSWRSWQRTQGLNRLDGRRDARRP